MCGCFFSSVGVAVVAFVAVVSIHCCATLLQVIHCNHTENNKEISDAEDD